MPTFFGNSFTPTDGGSNNTTSITLTPPASMNSGDLVVVYTTQRGTATISVGNDGGQSWQSLGRNVGTANVSLETFYCTFNGTWASNPQFSYSSGTNTTAVMLVFRPDNSSNIWQFENLDTINRASAASHTITGVTPSFDNNVTIASWHSADDNTWGNLSGTNWEKTSLQNQYRNLAGSDSSTTIAYQIQSTSASTNNVTQTQLTLGNDATACRIVTFYESVPVLGGFDPFGNLGYFGL